MKSDKSRYDDTCHLVENVTGSTLAFSTYSCRYYWHRPLRVIFLPCQPAPLTWTMQVSCAALTQ